MKTKTFTFLFLVLNVLDMLTTVVGLNAGLTEQNPLGAYAMSMLGVLPAMVIMKAIGCAFVIIVVNGLYQRYHPIIRPVILIVFMAVVLANVYQITQI